eukprot:TRINITY_DN1640_c0_g1_i1.p1 TRINITY_DN1640_c0_g1~~TRINITY_DN1640_c0_g1_i1.p1  ORF type:complete len:572 (-),score=161.08 TRINITY_DN1640_c0_g1_i1:168-1883(-)
MLRQGGINVSRLFKSTLKNGLTYRTFVTGKDLKFGTECRALMLQGVEQLAAAVEVTLGPKGRNVALDQSFGPPKITKDGVTVAKHIEFANRYMNLGAQLVREVANKTNNVAGDGTTTATVLTRAIFSEGCKAVAAGMNPMDLRRGINVAVDAVVKELRTRSKMISSLEETTQVATISANGDREIGSLLSMAISKVGKDAVISVQEGKTLKDELEVIEGMQLDQGFISRFFVTDPKVGKVDYEDPLICLTDKKLNSVQSVVPLLELASRERRKLLIIADAIEGDALSTLVLNRVRGMHVCAIKSPGYGDNRKVLLQDIAVLTGAEVISEELGLKIENVEARQLGTAKRVTITADDTIIFNGGGEKSIIEDRCSQIRGAMEQPGVSDYDREKYAQRYSKLSGGVAVIKVGGASEVEVNERKDRIVDALNATKAALDEGIVPGGGVALLNATKVLDNIKLDSFDQNVGIKIIKDALRIPCKAIANNAGFDGSVVVGKLLESSDPNYGFNASTGVYENMIKGGIVDPTKVVRTALIDAASVASLMTTTECMVVELPKRDAPLPPSGGMGGGYGDF